MLRRRLQGALVVVVATCAVTHVARGQATTVEGASVLIFPRVIADGTWDTTIQIGNGANRPAYAHCFYVNGALTNPALPPGPTNPPRWVPIDFPIALVRQQPTHWTASRGRLDDPSDPTCRQPPPVDCDGAGFDPGVVPAVPAGFTGELRCIEVDASGAPWSGNALYGVATLTNLTSREVVKYPAVGLPGFETNNADDTLCIGGNTRSSCAHGGEYGGCPLEWVVSHPSDADDRPTDGVARATDLTVVPCSENFESQVPAPMTLTFVLTNEFEQTFSAATTVTCWADLRLSDVNLVFGRAMLGGDWVLTRTRAAGATPRGYMLVQQTVRETARPPTFAAAAVIPAHTAQSVAADVITLPQRVGQ